MIVRFEEIVPINSLTIGPQPLGLSHLQVELEKNALLCENNVSSVEANRT